MTNRLLTCLMAATIGLTVALAPPAFARGGGGGGGGHGGGGRGGFGGGMHGGGGMAFAAVGGGHFAGAGFHGPHGFVHHGFFRHHRFIAFGGPVYAGYYDGCWHRALTPYGWQWVNACGYGWY
jgi:hypothetical protein